MKNIGNSILPSSCPRILQPAKFNGGILQVKPDEAKDTHSLYFTKAGSETVLASHPNGYSCHCLAERIVSGDADRIANQAHYIVECGGESDWVSIFEVAGHSTAALREARAKCEDEYATRMKRIEAHFARIDERKNQPTQNASRLCN